MKKILLISVSILFITSFANASFKEKKNKSNSVSKEYFAALKSPERSGFKNFLAKPGIIGKNHVSEYVDVYYAPTKYSDADYHDAQTHIADAEGFWRQAEALRNDLICESSSYWADVNLQHLSVTHLKVLKKDEILSGKGIWLQVIDDKGNVYTSYNSPVKAKQNTYRAGLYYYDPNFMDFRLADKNGKIIPVKAEMILHCYPDKMHVQALFRVPNNIKIRHAELVCEINNNAVNKKGSAIYKIENSDIGILSGKFSDNRITAEASVRPGKYYNMSAYLTFIPGENENINSLEDKINAETHPLSAGDFKLGNGAFGGYDPACGYYKIIGGNGIGIGGFTDFYRNPNMYLRSKIEIKNMNFPRKIYVRNTFNAGPIEAGILTDTSGFPLSTPVQASKNFGGDEKNENVKGFNESYFPVKLSKDEDTVFYSLHLHQNWGNHPIAQLSSIKFYQIYYHLSRGVTETTCYTLPTKFDSIAGGNYREYNLTDYRPLSGQTWIGQPQHDHVALQGWLQYLNKEGHWCYSRYTGSDIYSVGPNLAWFRMNYTSSDGNVNEKIEIMEMPQTDQTRDFLRIKYTFKHDVEIKGNVKENFRLLNKGSYILKAHWKKIAWLNPQGKIQIKQLKYNDEWSAVGEPLRSVNSFFCAYPYIGGNDALILRRVGGKVNGKPFNSVGFSAIGHKGNKTELVLVPLIKGNVIKAGSSIELDCILMPYGDDASSYIDPMQEAVRFGLSHQELADAGFDTSNTNLKIFGPEVHISHGELIRNLPPVVKAKENWAAFDYMGGHNKTSLIIKGFSSYKLPMLWDGSEFIDPQVLGGDGYQVVKDNDGSYCFVFAAGARTTRAGGKWNTETHSFIITEAVSEGNIKSVKSLNGEVKLKTSGKGMTTLKSPRIWCPAINLKNVKEPVYSSEFNSNEAETIPVELSTDADSLMCSVHSYSPQGFQMTVSCMKNILFQGSGLNPDSEYLLQVDEKQQNLKTNDLGEYKFTIPAGENIMLKCDLGKKEG